MLVVLVRCPFAKIRTLDGILKNFVVLARCTVVKIQSLGEFLRNLEKFGKVLPFCEVALVKIQSLSSSKLRLESLRKESSASGFWYFWGGKFHGLLLKKKTLVS